MTETELSAEIKSGAFSGSYFFWGDEDYMKNHRMSEMQHLVAGTGDFAAFNSFDIYYGSAEFDAGVLSDALLAPPMMAERKIVCVTFADVSGLKEIERNTFFQLIRENAGEDDVLIVSVMADGVDKRDKKRGAQFFADASGMMKCVEFTYQSEAKLYRWMCRHISEYGVTISEDVAGLIFRTCGRGMYTLGGEVEKLGAYCAAAGHSAVTADDVALCISRVTDDDTFRLANCITGGDTGGALACLNVKKKRREEPIIILSQITRAFSEMCTAAAFISDGLGLGDFMKAMNMKEYRAGIIYRAAKASELSFLSLIMDKCRDADRALKTGEGGYGAIERLICRGAGLRGAGK